MVVPSFIISELRTAFQMGFLLFIPFILIDLIVATVLMSMGMMMMPPHDHFLAVENPAVCAGGRLAPDRRLDRPEFWNLIIMNPEFATELLKSLMFEAVTLAAPILLTALVIGLASACFNPSRPSRNKRSRLSPRRWASWPSS